MKEFDQLLLDTRVRNLVSILLGATYPLGYLAATWTAFEDIHPDSGPLVYYPGHAPLALSVLGHL
nr:hypothetical protein [uncultured Lichenicoccus sp.]